MIGNWFCVQELVTQWLEKKIGEVGVVREGKQIINN